jgi:ABC-2 type transport system ATP-binding protein
VGINECDLAKDPVRFKQRVAYVSSETKFFDYLTVREHLSFFARLYKCGDKKEHIDKLLSIMELSEKQQHLPGSLSRGMKQKLMLACALVHDPEVMILDEPFTGLDPLAIRMLKDLLRDRANAGAIVIISSHLLNMVEELVDRILILQKGRKLVHGTAEEISTRLPDLRDNAGLEDIFIYATTHDDLPAFNSDGVIDE